MSNKPNLLFIIADDHRFDAINALGNPEVHTPNLDKLVASGTTLTHTYIMGSTVPAVCLPSRGMMLTGRTLYRFGEPDLGHYSLWPQMLRHNGYHTHGIGKWHNKPNSYTRCFESGAKIFFGGMSDHDAVPTHDFDPSGAYPPENCYRGEKFSTDLFADAAVDFLDTYEAENPFCLYLAFTAPHDPRTPPPEYAALYKPDDLTLPANFLSIHPFDNGEMDVRDEELAPKPRTSNNIRQHLADYYGMISHLDAHVGRILTTLEEKGQLENTLIVYTADHGLAVGQHGLLGKQNLYDHSMRIPLIISGPGIPQNQRHSALCYLFDMYPTLCQLTGTPLPPTVEGQSLVPLIQGQTSVHRESIFSAYRQEQRMVRQGDYKLIDYKVGDESRSQLFNLQDDPLEMNDLADEPEKAETLQRLQATLKRWQTQVNDPQS